MRTYHAVVMSLRAANEIIFEIIRQNDPFGWLHSRGLRSKMPIKSYPTSSSFPFAMKMQISRKWA